MSISPDYVLAKMEAKKARGQTKATAAPSGKRYYTPSRCHNDQTAPMLGSPMAVPAEYVIAKMEAKKSHGQAKSTAAHSGKHYYTSSRDRNAAAGPMLGSPIAAPPEYVVAKMQAEESRANHKSIATGRPNSSLPSTSRLSSALPVGTPMAVPAEYVWAKEQKRRSREEFREPSLSSGSSRARFSAETSCSFDKPAAVGRRSLGVRIMEYIH